MNIPIPETTPVAGWKQHPVADNGEKLVPVGPFSDYPEIFQDMIYFGERTQSSPYGLQELKGSLLTPFMREGVAERLVKASSLLPEGYALMVWDPYRTLEVQKSLFDYRVNELMTDIHKDDASYTRAKAEEEAQIAVSIPSSDRTKPSPHNTGGAVDLTIVKFEPEAWREMKKLNVQVKSSDWRVAYAAEMRRMQLLREHSKPLDMGVAFDEVAPEDRTVGMSPTAMRYYEKEAEVRALTPREEDIRRNRRLLYHVMNEAGFSCYEEEAWHFDYGNQFWGKKTGQPAIYSTADFSAACRTHETMRLNHMFGTMTMRQNPQTVRSNDQYFSAAYSAALANGNLRVTAHPLAAKI
jgi:D-alanyl-D-alanine dipeptidase